MKLKLILFIVTLILEILYIYYYSVIVERKNPNVDLNWIVKYLIVQLFCLASILIIYCLQKFFDLFSDDFEKILMIIFSNGLNMNIMFYLIIADKETEDDLISILSKISYITFSILQGLCLGFSFTFSCYYCIVYKDRRNIHNYNSI